MAGLLATNRLSAHLATLNLYYAMDKRLLAWGFIGNH